MLFNKNRRYINGLLKVCDTKTRSNATTSDFEKNVCFSTGFWP